MDFILRSNVAEEEGELPDQQHNKKVRIGTALYSTLHCTTSQALSGTRDGGRRGETRLDRRFLLK
jgi:hypothetical protein